MLICHAPSRPTPFRKSCRPIILIALGLLASLFCALPASAATIISTTETGMLALPPGQSIHVAVADVSNSLLGGSVEIELIDDNGDRLDRLDVHLNKNHTVVLSLDADDVVFAGPFLRLRAIIVIKKDDASDLQTLVSIVRYDPLTQTVEPLVQCVGPSADDPDTEFNGTCPQTQQTTTVDP